MLMSRSCHRLAANDEAVSEVAKMRAVHVRLGKIDNVSGIMNLPEYSDFAYRRLCDVTIKK